MVFKAVLFDMDGVIVDTEPLHRKAYFNMFEFYKLPVDDHLYNRFTGQSTYNVCQNLVDHFKIDEDPQNLVDKKRSYFRVLFKKDKEFDLLPGVKTLIEYYHNKSIPLILASSASMHTIDSVFDRFGLNPFFDGKISGADLEFSKPNPDIFIKAAKMAGQNPIDCLVIEDSTNGIIAAKDAGAYCVAYKSLHSKEQRYDLADKIIYDFNELMVY